MKKINPYIYGVPFDILNLFNAYGLNQPDNIINVFYAIDEVNWASNEDLLELDINDSFQRGWVWTDINPGMEQYPLERDIKKITGNGGKKGL
jgi:hypothetical protein